MSKRNGMWSKVDDEKQLREAMQFHSKEYSTEYVFWPRQLSRYGDQPPYKGPGWYFIFTDSVYCCSTYDCVTRAMFVDERISELKEQIGELACLLKTARELN